jgi:hypothetical protein
MAGFALDMMLEFLVAAKLGVNGARIWTSNVITLSEVEIFDINVDIAALIYLGIGMR